MAWGNEMVDEALHLFKHAPAIVFVITDVVMQGMSGVKPENQIQRFRPETKILFVSGYDKGNLQRYGIDDQSTILIKPYSIAELRGVMLGLIKN